MKLSFAISFQPTDFEAVGSGNFDQNLALLNKLGYEGVEIAIRNPDLIDRYALQSKLKKHNLQLVALGTGQAYVDEGISLTDINPDIRIEANNRIKKQLDFASYFGSQVIIGLIRGKIIDPNLKEKQMGFLENSISELCAYAERKRAALTIEPLNRYECNIFNRAEEVIQFIENFDSNYLRVLLDTFHMNIEEKELYQTIIDSKNYLSHVHFADSNRAYPGMGHINFDQIHQTLMQVNYNGFLSGEMLPLPTLKTAITQYLSKMREVMNG